MKKQTLTRNSIKQFSSFSAAFGQQNEFAEFIQTPFNSIADLHAQIALKKQEYSKETRTILVEELREQLNGIASESQLTNLELLASDNTFTVTTGHQLTLFAGPLYFVYKVLHIVKLAELFNQTYGDFRVVPVFWMASEDHDIDEVRAAHLFNKTLRWETNQTGAVGQMATDDFQEVYSELVTLFEGKETEIAELLRMKPEGTYQDYFQKLVTRLFADLGVLVIQPNTHRLKQCFIPVIRQELESQQAIVAVEGANRKIEEAGYKPQAVAREINLFYLQNQSRNRIEKVDAGFAVDGTIYSREELLRLVDEFPERFSPNVILRPLFQETILPNLAYIGGGGEMAYWIQLKPVFEAYGVQFPLIQQRISVQLIDGATKKKMDKTGWEASRFFEQGAELRKAFLSEHAGEEIDFSEIDQAYQQFKNTFVLKAKEVEPVLESMVEAELVRMEKQKEGLQQRILKQLKQKHEVALSAIDFVTDRFIPENTLQERYFHWLHFVPTGEYPAFFKSILAEIDPFETDLVILDLSE